MLRSVRLESVLTGKYTAIPIFLRIMLAGLLADVRRHRHARSAICSALGIDA